MKTYHYDYDACDTCPLSACVFDDHPHRLGKLDGQSRPRTLRWMYHNANGGKRDTEVGAALKTQGVKPGVPDL